MRVAISIFLLALLAAVGVYAYQGMMVPDAPVPTYGVVVFTIGAAVLAIVGIGLIALLFYSSRHGYDEPPHMER
ncbi:hypothetical protein JQ615_25260 [Bradyrhizobium jicamae]|uniref:Uncharacterized protein n=1 Tax=Bradyrhizobium jicamae TaxID=280332 RepID=A0ABS5FPJ9_9BRAD|nr:hypothetical protein [Bradyrhizobium jicamae]MBR0798702.1 hypothetical protein [Bradyrhizobium jicamae]MBR0934031.1 hypothetical protein [Bradyrhizobium jicamae]